MTYRVLIGFGNKITLDEKLQVELLSLSLERINPSFFFNFF